MEVCVILLIIEFIFLIRSMYCAVIEESRASWWGAAASMVAIVITYIVTPVPAPVIYPTNGQVAADGIVKIETETWFSEVYYSLDPYADPKRKGQRYDGEIRLDSSTTVLARTKFLTKWSELETQEMQLTDNPPSPTAIPTATPTTEPTVTPTIRPTATPTVKPTATPTVTLRKQTGEISDSWTEILAAIDDGSVEQRYAVGAWKELNLGKYGTVNMQLAGFNLDIRADGRGMVATTWIAKDQLLKTHIMCQNRYNWRDNGWKGSDLRNWLQNEVLFAFPDDLRNRLISVVKQQKLVDDNYNTYSQTTYDRLWILSRPEVSGKNSPYSELFQNEDSNLKKKRDGAVEWWWLRSAASCLTAYFVNSDGSSYNHYFVGETGGVCLCFCL